MTKKGTTDNFDKKNCGELGRGAASPPTPHQRPGLWEAPSVLPSLSQWPQWGGAGLQLLVVGPGGAVVQLGEALAVEDQPSGGGMEGGPRQGGGRGQC